MKLIVVGAGIVGLSCARAALLCGHQVTIVEQGPIPHPQGASFDHHRLIRYQYGDAIGYTRMVDQAFQAWERVWDDLGVTHFHRTGTLGVSTRPGDYTDRSASTFERIDIPHERLRAAEIEALCPQLSLPEGAWGLLNHDGGVLFADRIVTGLAEWVLARGANCREHRRVDAVDEASATVILEGGETLQGDALVIAAGAWLPTLLPRFAAMPTYRQAVCYVDPPAEDMPHWQTGPCLTDLGEGDNYALMPVGGTGLKFGSGAHRRAAKPSDGFAASVEEGHEVIAHFRPYLRNAERYRPVRMAVGYYVMDGTGHFHVTQSGKAAVVTNCDGQMFKFGPLIGERTVEVLAGRADATDLRRWASGQAS
ncbi:NAD(P)/FAD-dependent oxidoreductase [Lichenihabitans psoromatis]|uniref:NAD(P)/FAD-dependent oxidoreductase n=1 Tax=Lichenihabitans psoromatis TaxID=2528642 RepID=UPI0010366E5F|nr:FAD-dependent oxidoreductase [Lichenihabitans psoromatis]